MSAIILIRTQGELDMKKTLLASAATLALLLGTALAPQTVHAADGDAGDAPAATDVTDKPATGDSYAEFQVNAGDGSTGGNTGTGANAGLVLAQVPDLNFGSTNVAALIKGTTLKYFDGKTLTHGTGVDDQDGIIEVKDYRGTNAGWTLSAQLGNMSNGTTILPGTLSFNATTSQADAAPESTLTGSLEANVKGAAATVWSASANHGEGDNQAKVSTDKTTFTTQADAQATPGQYDAEMTWTLASVPTTTN